MEEYNFGLSPHKKSGLSEIWFWHKGNPQGTQIVKNTDLNLVLF